MTRGDALGLTVLRQTVHAANVDLHARGLAPFTFGNASGIDRERGLVVIKPSGVQYDALAPGDLVVTDLEGQVVEGTLKPSSDLATHLVLYRAWPSIGGIAHAHSHYATVWAQANREIPCLGTTHADHFHGTVPVTVPMTDDEIGGAYEANTGHAIVRRFASIDPLSMPAVLVAGHASFCWGGSVSDAAETAAVLEEVARMAFHTLVLEHAAPPLSDALRDRHFFRKHGEGRTYGQW